MRISPHKHPHKNQQVNSDEEDDASIEEPPSDKEPSSSLEVCPKPRARASGPNAPVPPETVEAALWKDFVNFSADEALNKLSSNPLLEWTKIMGKPVSTVSYPYVLLEACTSGFTPWGGDDDKAWFFGCLEKSKEGEKMIKFFEDREWLFFDEATSLVAMWLDEGCREREVLLCITNGKDWEADYAGTVPKDPKFFEMIPSLVYSAVHQLTYLFFSC